MFSWFRRDPRKRLNAQYAQKLEQARDAQRNGNILGYSDLMAEAEAILKELDCLSESNNNHSEH